MHRDIKKIQSSEGKSDCTENSQNVEKDGDNKTELEKGSDENDLETMEGKSNAGRIDGHKDNMEEEELKDEDLDKKEKSEADNTSINASSTSEELQEAVVMCGSKDRFEDNQSAFTVTPKETVLPAGHNMEFVITFAPPLVSTREISPFLNCN